MPRRWSGGPALVAVVALLAGLTGTAGCGVPTDGEVRTPGIADVPYGLLDEGSGGSRPSPSWPGSIQGQIALVTPDDRIRLVGRGVSDGPPERVAQAFLDQLSAGPSGSERGGGLDSGIRSGLRFAVLDVRAGVARVGLPDDLTNLAGDRVLLVVAQVVFSATSAPGVAAVIFDRDGQPVDAPLANGSLSAAPLRRSAYRSLVEGAR